ncbi:MAG: cytochrome c3 family protein [bacterium]
MKRLKLNYIFFPVLIYLSMFNVSYGSEIYNCIELNKSSIPSDVVTGKNGWIYVADNLDGKVYVFDKDGKPSFNFGKRGTGRGKFILPWSINVDSENFVYVTDIAQHQVQVFTPRGNWKGQFGGLGGGQGKFNMPFDMDFGKTGILFILDTGNSKVQLIKGSFLKQFGREGTADGELRNPTAIAVTEKGKVYIVDTGNNRVQIFSTRGDYINKFGKPGDELGAFFNPQGIAVDSMGRIFISDTGNNRIQCFDESGEVIFAFGKKGKGKGEFDEPVKIFVDKDDRLYVADLKNARIQIFSDVIYQYASCDVCHKENTQKTASTHPVYKKDCSACHLSHGKNPSLSLKKPLNDLCRDCHETDNTDFILKHNKYSVNKLNCVDCHSPHYSNDRKLLRGHKLVIQGKCNSCHINDSAGFRLIEDVKTLCYVCHTVQLNKKHSNLRSGNRCGLCHKSHGSGYRFILQRDFAYVCSDDNCHNGPDIEKHSHPYKSLYPSNRVKVSSELRTAGDGRILCLTCHDPHNSQHKSMLPVSKGALCVKCHGGFE